MKVAWLIQNLVPYHHARFEEFARINDYVDAYLIQVTNKDSFRVLEYKPPSQTYQIRTLFPGYDRATITPKVLTQRLEFVLKEIQPDCVCLSGWGMEIGQVLMRYSLTHNVPSVLFSESTSHDEPRVFYKEWVKKLLVTQASAVLVGGTYHRDYILKLGMKSEAIYDGHNVVDSTHFRTPVQKLPESIPAIFEIKPFFAACARFGKKKNLPTLVRAYKSYVDECAIKKTVPIHLLVAGEGEMRQAIEDEISRERMQNNITLLGPLDYNSLPWFYQHCHAFIHSSTIEQWGLVVNEAMAAGAPILLSERCGCSLDLLENGHNGYSFNPFSEKSISETLYRFTKLDKTQRRAFCERSTEIIAAWGPKRFARNLNEAVVFAVNSFVPKESWLTQRVIDLLLFLK